MTISSDTNCGFPSLMKCFWECAVFYESVSRNAGRRYETRKTLRYAQKGIQRKCGIWRLCHWFTKSKFLISGNSTISFFFVFEEQIGIKNPNRSSSGRHKNLMVVLPTFLDGLLQILQWLRSKQSLFFSKKKFGSFLSSQYQLIMIHL